MSERKVYSKYYPPDYDESKIPKLKKSKSAKSTVAESRIMLPMTIQCQSCRQFIGRGKKFNARKEYCEGEDYLGVKRWRFLFDCTACPNTISMKTDPEHRDYIIERGATRTYEPYHARDTDETEAKDAKDSEENDILKKLENKSRESKREMEEFRAIEELLDKNRENESLIATEQLLARVHGNDGKDSEDERADDEEAKRVFRQRKSTMFTAAAVALSPDGNFAGGSEPVNGGDAADVDDSDGVDVDIKATKQKLAASGLSFARTSPTLPGSRSQSKPPLPVPPSFSSAMVRGTKSSEANSAPISVVSVSRKRKAGPEVSFKQPKSAVAALPPASAAQSAGLMSLVGTYISDSGSDSDAAD